MLLCPGVAATLTPFPVYMVSKILSPKPKKPKHVEPSILLLTAR